MNEPHFCDYQLLLDEQSVIGATKSLTEFAGQPAASTVTNSLLKTMTKLVVPASGEACTTKVQFSSKYKQVQFLRFAIAIVPVRRSRF